MVRIIFVAANSLINLIIYAIRMPELRAGILQIIFLRTLNPVYPIDIPLQNIKTSILRVFKMFAKNKKLGEFLIKLILPSMPSDLF